jgi:hypothetical protein
MLQMADSRRRFVMPRDPAIGPDDPGAKVLIDGTTMVFLDLDQDCCRK